MWLRWTVNRPAARSTQNVLKDAVRRCSRAPANYCYFMSIYLRCVPVWSEMHNKSSQNTTICPTQIWATCFDQTSLSGWPLQRQMYTQQWCQHSHLSMNAAVYAFSFYFWWPGWWRPCLFETCSWCQLIALLCSDCIDPEFLEHYFINRGAGSSVGIATDYGLDGSGSNPGGDEILRPSSPGLGPTQPPVKWVPGLSRG